MRCSRALAAGALLVAALVGCTPGPAGTFSQEEGEARVWIDAPLDGSSLPLAPYQVVIHASAAGGVAEVELSVGDDVLFSGAPSGPPDDLVTLRHVWVPPGPGEYVLYARAQGESGGWGEARASVTVVEAPSITPTATSTPAPVPTLTPTFTAAPQPTSTSTPTPQPTSAPAPTAAPQPPAIAEVKTSADVFYSDPLCGDTQVVFQAIVEDPSGVTGVMVSYRLKDVASGAETAWASLPADRFLGSPATKANWLCVLDAGEDFAGANPGREYELQVRFVATNAHGLAAESPVHRGVRLVTRACVR